MFVFSAKTLDNVLCGCYIVVIAEELAITHSLEEISAKKRKVQSMAVTRSFLKGMGLTDEQIGAIIDAHTDTVDGLKDSLKAAKADADKLQAVQKELEALKANSGDDWKAKYDTLKKTFDDFKTETASREKTEKVKTAYAQLLREANVDSKRIDAILRITDLSSMQLDESGALVDAEALTSKIKTEWSAFIQTTGTKGANVETPPDTHGAAALTKADIYAKDEHGRYKMSTAERQKALVEHPEIMKG